MGVGRAKGERKGLRNGCGTWWPLEEQDSEQTHTWLLLQLPALSRCQRLQHE